MTRKRVGSPSRSGRPRPFSGDAAASRRMRYIAFLRGINVGGHTVKMERLRQLFTELGLAHVRTYIQSGNVFFETTDSDRARVTGTIEEHLHKVLGYEVPVFLR